MHLWVFSMFLSLTITFDIYSMSLLRSLVHTKHEQAPQEAPAPAYLVQNNSAQQAPVQVPITPIIPVYNQPAPQITVNVQLQNTNTNTVEVEQTVYTQVWQKTQTQVHQAFDWLKQCSTIHKKKLGAIAVVTLYASTQATILYLQHRLHSKLWWSFWQQDKSLQELYIVPQKQLAHELLNAVQTRYTKTNNPLDYATPLVLFTRELEQEVCLLTRYKKLISALEHIKLSKLFFYKQKFIQKYTERLNRLAYIKSCFFNSLISHKVSHIQ